MVDSRGQTIDFRLSARRDAAAARRFFRKALHQPHTINPRRITVDKNAAYPCATKAMKRAGELWRFSKLRRTWGKTPGMQVGIRLLVIAGASVSAAFARPTRLQSEGSPGLLPLVPL